MGDLQPVQLLDNASKHRLIERYGNHNAPLSRLDYATVRDFCDSADHLPQVCYRNGDLKNVQRAWIVKAILGHVPIGSKLLEIGGGVPLAAGMLAEFGYDVTLVDPYEGAGNGPTEYELYTRKFPAVTFIKDYFSSNLHIPAGNKYDCIYSISVLEHIPPAGIDAVFDGIQTFLKTQGTSIHCIDVVVEGNGDQAHIDLLKQVVYRQMRLEEPSSTRDDSNQACDDCLSVMRQDLETFYLSAEGHNLWRSTMAYEEFPFRKVISAQTAVQKAA